MSFSLLFPLPIRVSTLVSLGLFTWASNLHLLNSLQIDTSSIFENPQQLPSTGSTSTSTSTSNLHLQVYKAASVYGLYTLLSWILYKLLFLPTTPTTLSTSALIFLSFSALLPIFILLLPPSKFLHSKFFPKLRYQFISSLIRVLTPSFSQNVHFSEVILADILTSFAKVIGDAGLVLETLVVMLGVGKWLGLGGDYDKPAGWTVPVLTSLPYVLRLRQCLSEYFISTSPTQSHRALLNALKYSSALPVIFLSSLLGPHADPFDEETSSPGVVVVEGISDGGYARRWLWNIWILSVLVNSLYSFWWDVTNDWGLSLLVIKEWRSAKFSAALSPLPSPTLSLRRSFSPVGSSRDERNGNAGRRRAGSIGSRTEDIEMVAANNGLHHKNYPQPAQNSNSTSPSTLPIPYEAHRLSEKPSEPSSSSLSSRSASHPSLPNPSNSTFLEPMSYFPPSALRPITPPHTHRFLRPTLLLPDPHIYHLCIFLDLLLRFTWSLKLSSHLHHVHEIESGIFMLETLEVIRRWMWVFLRVEWEAVRRGTVHGHTHLGVGVGKSPMLGKGVLWEAKGIEEMGREGGEEEIGLGVLVEKKEKM